MGVKAIAHHAWPLELELLGCGCSRAISRCRALFFLPCILPCTEGSFQGSTQLHRRGIFSEGGPMRVLWESENGEARNNGGTVLVFCFRRRIPGGRKTKKRWCFWFWTRRSAPACLKGTYPPLALCLTNPPYVAFFCLTTVWVHIPPCQIVCNDQIFVLSRFLLQPSLRLVCLEQAKFPFKTTRLHHSLVSASSRTTLTVVIKW
jgi:hypothetical protein